MLARKRHHGGMKLLKMIRRLTEVEITHHEGGRKEWRWQRRSRLALVRVPRSATRITHCLESLASSYFIIRTFVYKHSIQHTLRNVSRIVRLAVGCTAWHIKRIPLKHYLISLGDVFLFRYDIHFVLVLDNITSPAQRYLPRVRDMNLNSISAWVLGSARGFDDAHSLLRHSTSIFWRFPSEYLRGLSAPLSIYPKSWFYNRTSKLHITTFHSWSSS